MRAHLFSLTLLSAAFGVSAAAWAHPEYRVTIVAPAGSVATGINNAGAVIGNFPFSATVNHAFLNRGSGMVDIGASRPGDSNAVSINNKGQVLGHFTGPAGTYRGYIYAAGVSRDIGTIGGFATFYTDINDHGHITATGYKFDSFDGSRGLLRAPNGTFRDIGSLPVDNPLTNAHALNNSNHVAGSSGPLTFPEQPLRAIVWSKGIMRDIGGFGWEPNEALDINECGQMTGFAAVPTGIHDRVAILYSKGRLINIDGRPDIDFRFSEGTSINNHGHVVGYSDHLSGFVYRGKRMQSLNALIDPKSGWDIQFPRGINDKGQIAATAVRGGVQYAVRLDLIRPHLLRAPEMTLEDGSPAPAIPALTAAEAKNEAAAQMREVVRPVRQ